MGANRPPDIEPFSLKSEMGLTVRDLLATITVSATVVRTLGLPSGTCVTYEDE